MKIWKGYTTTPDAVKPLPFHVYFWSVCTVMTAGLLDSIYLAFSHYRTHTDILYSSFCAISGAFNCDTVAQSPYSIAMGVPLAVWGVAGYGFLLVLMASAGSSGAGRRRIWALIFICVLCFAIHSIFLAAVSRYYIKAYCILCIASYAINFLLVFQVWIIRRRFPESGFFNSLKKDLLFLWKAGKKRKTPIAVILTAVFLLPAVFPAYWKFELPSISSDMATGMTEDESPWIGAEEPELVIIEYSDYRCFQCKKAHYYLRQIIARNPNKIRLVHRHFPMDPLFNPLVKKALHQGSGKMAIAAAYAATKQRFWQVNDLLYEIPKGARYLDIKNIAQKSGVDLEGLKTATQNKLLKYKIKTDVKKGIELGIVGTPAYEIKGKLYQGRIPLEVMEILKHGN